jgi:predicted branched-subunit amino acid permease
MWACGTALGISMGNILPARIVSALGVALFGMFLAVIIPPSRKDKAVGACVAVSFACSYAATRLPFISGLSQGNRTIILTVLISGLFAALFPREDKETQTDAASDGGGIEISEAEMPEALNEISEAKGGDADA